MSVNEQNIEDILQNLSGLQLDQIVTWILNNIEFDKIISCINKSFQDSKGKLPPVFDIPTLKSNTVVKQSYDKAEPYPDWYFKPETYEDIVLHIIEKTRNKVFAPTKVYFSTSQNNDYHRKPKYSNKPGLVISCVYQNGMSFEMSYSHMYHFMRYIDYVPDHTAMELLEGTSENTVTFDDVPDQNTVPILVGTIWANPGVLKGASQEHYSSDMFWEEISKEGYLSGELSLSTPRVLRLTNDGKLEPNKNNVSYKIDPFHIPGEFGMEGKVISTNNQVIKKAKELFICKDKHLKQQVMSGFGNIQMAAAKKDIYISHYSFGSSKFHVYNFTNDWDRDSKGNLKGKWLSKGQLAKLARSKKPGTPSKKGYKNFMSAFGNCQANYQPLGQDLQARPVSPHRFGYAKRLKNKFGSSHKKKPRHCFGSAPNKYSKVNTQWGSHGGFPSVQYGYKGTQSRYGGTTGIVGGPSNLNYILNQ